jgi:hypothetical protein
MNSRHVHKGKYLTLTLTFQDTLEAIQERRPCSPASLRRYLRRLHIKPLGTLRTKPYRFEADTPGKILDALGEKVVTMQQLLAVKRKAQKARAA